MSRNRKKIMILIQMFDTVTARAIRIENLFKHLTEDYDIHILKINHPKLNRCIPNTTVHNLRLNDVESTMIVNDYNSGKVLSKKNIISRLSSKVFKELIFFPDIWASMQRKVVKYFSSYADLKFDILYVVIFPFSNLELTNKLKQLPPFSNARIIYDIGDPLFNNSAHSKKNSTKKRSYEEKHLVHSDKLIVTNSETKKHFNNTFNYHLSNIEVIPQGVNLDIFGKCTNSSYVDGVVRYCYAGIFYERLRNPKIFFSAVKKVSESIDLKIKLFGSNYDPNLRSIEVYKGIPQSDLIKEFSTAHVLLYFDNAFGIQTSGKIYELLATKKPILFIYENDKSEVLKLAKDYSHVIKVKNNLEQIQKVLLEFPKILKTAQINNYDTQIFGWKQRTQKLKQILNNL